MKKNYFMMAIGVVAMLMSVQTSLYAAQKSADEVIPFVLDDDDDDDDDRGTEIKLTAAEEYALKKPAKRAVGKGTSRNETNAEMSARTAARGAFAEAISAAILSASKRVYGEMDYFKEMDITDEEGDSYNSKEWREGGEKNNSKVESFASEVIKNCPVVKKNKFYNKKKRRYTVYVCLEYDGEVKDMIDKVVKKIRQDIPMEDRKRIDENLEKFELEIEKSMNKPESNNDEDNNDDDE
jgi:hypothetical protein